MYKDIVIKKRVWMPEDDILDVWDIFDVDEEIEYETTIVDFNGRIPIDDGVIVGEWMTNGIQLIRADMGELLSEGEGMIQTVNVDKINRLLDSIKPIPGTLLPVGIYEYKRWSSGIEFSNGENQVVISLQYFQYIYDAGFDYELFLDAAGSGLALKRNGLVCGAVIGLDTRQYEKIWQRPYSLEDVEALTSIQGDPTLP